MAATLMGGVWGAWAYAQDGGGERQRGNRQVSDEDRASRAERFEQRRQEQAQRLQESLGATDEDFAVLSPMIQAVQELQREANFARRGAAQTRQRRGGGDRGPENAGNPGGPDTPPEMSAEASAVRDASTALSEAVEDPGVPAQVLQERIAALRSAKSALNAKLVAAQTELRSVLMARQEAVLIVRGVLD